MKTNQRILQTAALSAIIAIFPSALYGQTIPAFSGADGAARNVTGGRGGIVYHVTKLNSAIDDPARNDVGTIRYGLNNANFPANTPRTIVFDVGGVFHLGRLTQPNAANGPWDPNGNGWDAQSRLTIGGTSVTLAGQTAPGVGVIFMGGGLKPQGNNNIIRNITMASGYGLTGWWSPGNAMRAAPGTTAAGTDASQWYPDNTVYDAMDIAGTNIMIDHVSTIYATDETISMNEVAKNITVQYSNISQGQNYPQWDAEGGGLTGHALGSLLEAGNTTQAAISFHHNLYAHLKGRTPQMQSQSSPNGSPAYYDFRDNVFYNWMGTAGSKSGNTNLNLVNNFYLAGNGGDNPIGGSTAGWTNASGGTGVISPTSTIHRLGNVLDSNKDGDANDGTTLNNTNGAASPLWMSGVVTYTGVTDTAQQAYDRVLNYMGANWWNRNLADARIVNEVRSGTGKIVAWADDPWNTDPAEGVEWRSLLNSTPVSRPANFDTDQDGMPDTWEAKHGLNASVADNNGDFDTDGYTNLEEYLNELAEWPAPNAITFNAATNTRYAQITNWHLLSTPTADDVWQPGKYDTAKLNSGTLVVDAPGQHAGTLNIGATGVSASATFNVTSGWIEVATSTVVAANGIVTVSAAGTLTTSNLTSIPAITNHGVINVNSGGSINALNGSGLLNVAGGSLTTTSIAQNFLTINSGATLNATSLNITSGSANDGALNTSLGGSIAGIVGSGTLNVTGGNLASAGAIIQNSLVVGNSRTVSINPNGGANSVSRIKLLSLVTDGAGGYLSSLELHNNDLVIDYTGSVSQYATTVNQVKKGLTLLGGNGKGITSAEVDNQSLAGTVLAVVDNGIVGGEFTSLSGYIGVPAESVLVKYTWFGDSNLDGVVDGADYALIDTGFTSGGTMGSWLFGDYNYDGAVTGEDYALIDTGFIAQSGVLPEPAFLSCLSMIGMGILRRRFRC